MIEKMHHYADVTFIEDGMRWGCYPLYVFDTGRSPNTSKKRPSRNLGLKFVLGAFCLFGASATNRASFSEDHDFMSVRLVFSV